MALPELDAEYRRRLTQPGVYSYLSKAGQSWLDLKSSFFGISAPEKIGHGMLLFGRFADIGRVVCQPWAVNPVLQGERDVIGGRHGLVSNELIDIHDEYGNLAAEGPDSDYDITRRAWSTYFWPTPEGVTNVIVTEASMLSYDTPLSEEEMAAVAVETLTGNSMENHEVYLWNHEKVGPYAHIALGRIAMY